MNARWRKLLSLLLCLVMVVGLFPASALAEGEMEDPAPAEEPVGAIQESPDEEPPEEEDPSTPPVGSAQDDTAEEPVGDGAPGVPEEDEADWVAMPLTESDFNIQLDVPLYAQETGNTCAFASARMCIGYYLNHELATGLSASPPTEGTLVSRYPSGGTDPIVYGLRDYCGVSFGYRDKPAYEAFCADVQASLQSGNPVVLEVYMNSSTSWVLGYTTPGHYVVISGLKKSGDSLLATVTDPYHANGAGIGQVVYVELAHMYNISNYYLRCTDGTTAAGTLPVAVLDDATGGAGVIDMHGWAFDWDEPDSAVPIHIYVGGPAGSGANGYAIEANTYREDVNAAYPGIGCYHGFSTTIEVTERGQQTLYFYACDLGHGLPAKLFATVTVTITEPSVNTYTVTYDANGGTGAPEAQTKTHDVALTLSGAVPTREGYTFLGWATDRNAAEAEYQPGDSFTLNASTNLYAVWEKNMPETEAKLVVGGGSVRVGQEIQIPVSLENNPGVVSIEIHVQYDEALLEWTGVTAGNYGGTFYGEVGDSLTWYAADPAVNETMDDVFVTLTFRVKDDAPAGTTQVSVIYYEDCIYNAEEIDVPFQTVPGEIEIITYIPGDINGDGVVNNKDLTRLQRYLKGQAVEVVEAALDVNGDGKINNKDATRLQRYLKTGDVEIH